MSTPAWGAARGAALRGLRRLCLGLLLTAPVCASFAATPSFGEVKAAYRPSEAWLLDRHGEVLSSRRLDAKVRRLEWVGLADLSPAMTAALLAAEDKRFFSHGGVDWLGMASAILDNLGRGVDGRRLRGASTLTMQLAGFLDPALNARGGRSLGQKWDQAQAARDLERTWSKAEILEAYLNLAPFRGELSGIHAAARALFGKHPSGLDQLEALLLAAQLRNPGAAARTVAQRACAVAKSLPDTAASTPPATLCADLENLALAHLSGKADPMNAPGLAPHVALQLLKTPGTKVRSTLDARLQRLALAALNRHLAELQGRNVADGALVILDNASGDVLAWVGSNEPSSQAAQVDGVVALRQAGSTLKPFLYGQAIEAGLLSAASLLDDAPTQIAVAGGIYVPQNYDKDFKGPVSVRTALASSLNVPAVRTLLLLGEERFAARLRALGLESVNEQGDFYGPGLALGAADVRLIQLANAYRTLANGGLSSPVRLTLDEARAKKRRVMPDTAAWIIGDILADRGARATTFGLENALATRRWAAAKTGTSKDMRDNWCIGWSPRFTVAVWVGNFDGSPMHDVSGVSGAAPIWREMMDALEAQGTSNAPKAPPSLESRTLHYRPAVEPPRTEWFLAGSAVDEVVLSEGLPRILNPVQGSILALDPDIPAQNQQILLEARGGAALHLDGHFLSSASRQFWSLQAGRHRLELVDSAGQVLDTVEFSVRGPGQDPAQSDQSAPDAAQ